MKLRQILDLVDINGLLEDTHAYYMKRHHIYTTYVWFQAKVDKYMRVVAYMIDCQYLVPGTW